LETFKFVGIQEDGEGRQFPLYNLLVDIPGHPKNSTVGVDTLKKAGLMK